MIYFYGASGHAKAVLEIAEELSLPIGGLVDLNPEIKELLGYVVSTINPAINGHRFIISIGNNLIRKKIAESLKVEFVSLIHPKSNISKRVNLGKGTVVMAGVSINSSSNIGSHVILNTNCSIDHECIIDDYAHISPNVALAGNVHVGEGSHVGIGASVIQGIKIGKWCTIGAGSVILKDVPDYGVVVGNPGRIIKWNSDK